MTILQQIAEFFLPEYVRHNKAHPKYQELYNITSLGSIAMVIMSLFPMFMLYLGKPATGYFINFGLGICLLLSIKWFGHYRIPMTLMAIITYFIIYDLIKDSGFIYSSNTSILHMYLLAAIWADKRYGWYSIFSNLLVFSYIFYQTIHNPPPATFTAILGSPVYAFGMHCLITVFFGGVLSYEQYDQDRSRRKIRALQDQRISQLDEAVLKRTEQLNTFRQALATDFHDQTGNMLSAITRQASLLKIKMKDSEVLPLVESIIANSNELYDSSKDFLWNLNHNSDNPMEVFNYLTGYGQAFYNQFNIPFSSEVMGEGQPLSQLEPFAALNLIFIFKEAMTNVIKHADAGEVCMEMKYNGSTVVFVLGDDGTWKLRDESQPHYGLSNIEQRCKKNNFGFAILRNNNGTRIEITVPVKIEFVA